MSFFTCAVHVDGGQVPDTFSRQLQSGVYCRDKRIRWHGSEAFVGAIGLDDGSSKGCLGQWRNAVGIGVVRLDNRAEIMRWTECREPGVSDLELAMRFLIGPISSATRATAAERVSRLLGDFAFVVWDAETRELVATRDALGVKKLYYATGSDGLVKLSSRAELIAQGERYDMEYLVSRLSDHPLPPGRTVYNAVYAVPSAGFIRFHRNHLSETTYWSPADVQRSGAIEGAEHEIVAAFREHFFDSVALRLGDGRRTWSHLSGGLDSSSVVSAAQWLERSGQVRHGLAGTVSFVDQLGSGADEKEYSDAVVSHYHVPNEPVPHQGSWRAALLDPQRFDQPNQSYPWNVRNWRVARLIRAAGGQVLLTGMGGDHLLLTTMFFFADGIARGHLAKVVRQMALLAVAGRVSFWELAYKNALLPILPASLRRALLPKSEGASVTPWLAPTVTRAYDLATRPGLDAFYAGRFGHKYTDSLAATVASLPPTLPDRFAEEVLDLRHPFLYRPLVELALRLPPHLCVRPHARKWVLREAMRGILPEKVRTRVGKGEAQGILRWSLIQERQLLAQVLRDPILAQLGCIDPHELRDVLANAASERRAPDWLLARAHIAVDLELWLQLRAGRWVAAESQISNTAPVVAG
jgi:asparagine synthase (glutamine-hydrolysing)